MISVIAALNPRVIARSVVINGSGIKIEK